MVGLIHVALIAPHYFVGSFDDDASYIMTARALIAGKGLTGHVASGAVVAGLYPPGYAALLAPLVWLWPHTFAPLRLLSTACYAAVLCLTWVYLGRRQVPDPVRIATLWLLALGPALATFGTMVMAESPFLVLFLVLLLLTDRWEQQHKIVSVTGLGVLVATAGLVWLKEAGIGVVAGLVLWLLLNRRRSWSESAQRAGVVAVGAAALVAPVVIARHLAGVPLAGSRYTQELGAYYTGGLAARLVHVVPSGLHQMLSTALAATIVPYGSPFPAGKVPDHVLTVLSWHVAVLTAIGGVVWFRRHRDAAIAIVPTYLAMTLLWPAVNERRVILVIPLVAAWYVLGWVALWRAVRSRAASARQTTGARIATAGLAAVVVAAPLLAQMPRDYLFDPDQSSSHFPGSRYVRVLAQVGAPSDVVESDYLSSTALFTGHRTAQTAFGVGPCDASPVLAAIGADNAGFLLLGDINKPGVVDSSCLLDLASQNPWAVRLLFTERDQTSVFELIGPGTGHPRLQDLAETARVTTATSGSSQIMQWDWGGPQAVAQVSAGEVAPANGTATAVSIELLIPGSGWRTVAHAASAVGDRQPVPYLLAGLPPGTVATAMRIVVDGGPRVGPVVAFDVHALGEMAKP